MASFSDSRDQKALMVEPGRAPERSDPLGGGHFANRNGGKTEMSDEQTAGTLVLVGAIFQLIVSILLLLVGFLFFSLFVIFVDFADLMVTLLVMLVPIILFAMGGVSLIFAILWLNWRSHPSAHKTGLIVTGILGLIFGLFLPGLLVLIGGAIAPGPESA